MFGVFETANTQERTDLSFRSIDGPPPVALIWLASRDHVLPQVGDERTVEVQEMFRSDNDEPIVEAHQRDEGREILHLLIGYIPIRFQRLGRRDQQILGD